MALKQLALICNKNIDFTNKPIIAAIELQTDSKTKDFETKCK